MVFCTDILDALTQDFFARKGNPIEEPSHVEEVKVSLRVATPHTISSIYRELITQESE